LDALSALLAEHGPRIATQLATQIQSVYRGLLDAEDVMQVSYLEAFLRIRQFTWRGPDSFAAWLSQIASNNLLDAIRELERQKRPPADRRIVTAGSDTGPNALLDRLGWTSTTPSRSVSNEELRERLSGTLDRLPRDYAAVLRMYDLEGGRPDEVAARMNRSVGAVHMLRARAIDHLRTLFADMMSETGGRP
jgi:RNA polymerase sigma-70 factor (ECF subfamily)